MPISSGSTPALRRHKSCMYKFIINAPAPICAQSVLSLVTMNNFSNETSGSMVNNVDIASYLNILSLVRLKQHEQLNCT